MSCYCQCGHKEEVLTLRREEEDEYNYLMGLTVPVGVGKLTPGFYCLQHAEGLAGTVRVMYQDCIQKNVLL